MVQNIPEVSPIGRSTLAERLVRLAEVFAAAAHVEVLPLENFQPRDDESYLIGFTGHKQAALRDQLQGRFAISFATVVHPRAIVSPSAKIGSGTIVNAGAIIASNAQIGDHVLINRGATVGHDTQIGDFSIIQPGANLAGHIRCGTGATVGIGASIIEDRHIGDHAQIAGGAVVIHDVPALTLVAGVPAVVKKQLLNPTS